MGNVKPQAAFSSGYRFWEGDRVSAILDTNGALSLKDERGSLEVWQSWRDYIKEVTGDNPVTGGEDCVVEQLSLTLGKSQCISAPAPSDGPQGKDGDMKNATAAKAAPKKATAAKKTGPVMAEVAAAKKTTKPAKAELHDCLCGCGKKTSSPNRKFKQGHDSRFHSHLKAIERGEMKLSDLTPAGVEEAKALGIKPGSAKK